VFAKERLGKFLNKRFVISSRRLAFQDKYHYFKDENGVLCYLFSPFIDNR